MLLSAWRQWCLSLSTMFASSLTSNNTFICVLRCNVLCVCRPLRGGQPKPTPAFSAKAIVSARASQITAAVPPRRVQSPRELIYLNFLHPATPRGAQTHSAAPPAAVLGRAALCSGAHLIRCYLALRCRGAPAGAGTFHFLGERVIIMCRCAARAHSCRHFCYVANFKLNTTNVSGGNCAWRLRRSGLALFFRCTQ